MSHEYEKAFTNLRCGIITTDNNGNVLFMNSIAEFFTGFELNKVKNKFISDVLVFDYKGLTNQLLNEVKRKGSVYHDEDYYILVTNNGNKIRVKIKVGNQHIDDSSFITFFIWENAVYSTTGLLEMNGRKNIDVPVDSEINLMIASESSLMREGITNALSSAENIKIACMASKKIEYIECLNKYKLDIVIINDDDPESDYLFDNINFIQNINKELKIVVTSKCINEEKELRLLSFGVKGFIVTGEERYDLVYSIHSVFNGDLWFRRQTLNNFVNINLNIRHVYNDSGYMLTSKEKEIFEYVSKGLSNKNISEILAIGEKTVKNYINRINKKLGLNIRKELNI